MLVPTKQSFRQYMVKEKRKNTSLETSNSGGTAALTHRVGGAVSQFKKKLRKTTAESIVQAPISLTLTHH